MRRFTAISSRKTTRAPASSRTSTVAPSNMRATGNRSRTLAVGGTAAFDHPDIEVVLVKCLARVGVVALDRDVEERFGYHTAHSSRQYKNWRGCVGTLAEQRTKHRHRLGDSRVERRSLLERPAQGVAVRQFDRPVDDNLDEPFRTLVLCDTVIVPNYLRGPSSL